MPSATSGRPASTHWHAAGAGAVLRPGTARIAVDLLGGDGAPAVVVDGALRACGADPDLNLILVGPMEVAEQMIHALPAADRHRLTVRAVHEAVGMTDAPSMASRHDTTVRATIAAVAEGAADALVSAGATGATVTAAALGLGRVNGVRRPALAATLPAVAGPVVLLDVGASVEVSAATLVRHAGLGAAYARVVHRLERPRVGLLSIGTEPGKGDRTRRGADAALRAGTLPAGAVYVGLVEGYEVSTGERVDVVVTDGFTGNVLLKGIEGAYAMAGGPPPGGRAPRAGVLLGVGGPTVICHGAAAGEDVASGIALAADLHRHGVLPAVMALLDAAEGSAG